MVAVYHLFTIGYMSAICAWLVMIVQASKLAHLMGYTFEVIASIAILLFAYTVPFVMQLSGSQDSESEVVHSHKDNKKISVLYVQLYLLIGFFASIGGGRTLAPIILSSTLGKSVSVVEVFSLCIASFFLFASTLITELWKGAHFVRSALLLISGFLVLVATEALGPLTIQADPTSSTYLVISLHPELAQGDHSGLFLLATAFLVATAFIGLYPIQRPLPRVLFAISFSYCTAHAMIGAAFPASMGADAPHNGSFELPWVYSFVFSILSTSTALKAMANIVSKRKSSGVSQSLTKDYVFITWSVLPIGALGWSLIEDSLRYYICKYS